MTDVGGIVLLMAMLGVGGGTLGLVLRDEYRAWRRRRNR